MHTAYEKILDTLTVLGPTDKVTSKDVAELISRQLEIFTNYPLAREAIQNHVLLQAFAVIAGFNPMARDAAEHAQAFVHQTTDRKFAKVTKQGFQV